MDAYLPAMPIMADFFSVNIVAINNTLSTYLLGQALGQALGGPISDQIGRKPVGLFGLVIFVLASIGITSASTVTQVQLLRLIQAIGGGAATVICIPSIRDVYHAREAGRKFAAVMMIMMLAPLIAPTVGSVLLKINWQTIFYFLSAYGVFLFIFYIVAIPETRPNTKKNISLSSIFPQYFEVISHQVNGKHIAIRYALTMALSGGIMMTFLTNVSFAYIKYFGISESIFPLFFSGMPLGFLVANMISMKMMKTHNPQGLYKTGNVLQLLFLLSLVIIVFTDKISLYTFIPLIIISVSLGGIITPCGSAMYMSYFKKISGSAASLMSTSMFLLGAALGALSGVFFDGTLLPMTVTMLGASIIANIVSHSIPHEILEDH